MGRVRIMSLGSQDGFGYKKIWPEPSSLPFLCEMYLGIMEAGLVGRLRESRNNKSRMPWLNWFQTLG